MNKGITLFELIVVLMVVSIIAGSIVTIYYNTTNAELSNYTKQEMERLKLALLDFFRDCDQFPMDTAAIDTDFLDLERQPLTSDRYYGSAATKTWRLNQWNGAYIQDKFNDNGYMKDAWQEDYIYDYTNPNLYCTITSYGPNRASGGGDDITVTVNAIALKRDKELQTLDELDIIQNSLRDYVGATSNAPAQVGDLFEWEVLNLHMDEALWNSTADEVIDYGGSANHGIAYGNATTTSSGKVQRAGTFDGSGDYARTAAINLGSNFSVEFWMKPVLLYNYGDPLSAGTTDYWLAFVTYADGHMNYAIGNGSSWGNAINPGVGTFVNGTWYHIVGTYNGSQTELFVNGISEGTASNSGYSLNQVINVGSRTATGYDFNGIIDEVRIYSVALSADEIFRHFDNPGCPKDYFDLHDYSFKYDAWETEYALASTSIGGETVYYFYSYGPDRADDSGADDDIKPRGL